MTRQEAQRLGHVALVVGGDSAEREISLRGGQAVARGLEALGVQFSVVDGPRRLLEQVAAGHFDRVFNLLHGRGGEDGALQGALRLYGVPVTGSGVLGSALTMDKVQTKRVWQACDLPTPGWRLATSTDQVDAVLGALNLPLFVKPAREGSSIGMSRVNEPEQLAPAIERSLAHDASVLVEQLIEGREFTAAVLDGHVLPLIELRTGREFYDYEAKYESGDTEYVCPCGLPEALETRLARICREAFEVVGAAGWGRVDFMLDEAEQPWLLEVNTTPGMTEKSLMPMAARAAGIEFEELVWRILNRCRID
ncbi:D-alanine--D-alanine ligase [Wenzhouxiangella limi]|uniref:D-alanine--D-alanine ligase n=1 Tax=Wenzhouxiangella limi TaxID=2707351 RepID=A0A845V1S5_9GAMM|nr:D-alanine--D-alanine ligase [Wenzhouxiangella limi]NDY96674.1 D-alanine--D-alanine ligase [Wenzhouxiangella limi]